MKTYLTEYYKDGTRYGSRIYGDGWADARANADVFGLGAVIGELVEVIE